MFSHGYIERDISIHKIKYFNDATICDKEKSKTVIHHLCVYETLKFHQL